MNYVSTLCCPPESIPGQFPKNRACANQSECLNVLYTESLLLSSRQILIIPKTFLLTSKPY